jgi:DNA invertase Pin-like site-specific DNA recombinase/predicted DNA-binding transcriptional regulator AlpA
MAPPRLPTPEPAKGPPLRGHTKITASHLSRRALIYVRQSTLAQVRNNTESTARQYGLTGLAARLGWAAAGIEVIDADLGLSGQLAEGRAGFKEVVGRVCLGEAGAILGLEVSRLARSSADLAKLLELARLTETLVIDADGVYDLADINDRMLLGLKNQMAEAELHILGSRMDKAKRSAAARGELRLQLATGFVRDDGTIAIDPDQEVQAAVRDLFTAFTATGSAYGVAGAFAGRRFPRRSYTGELTWAPLTYDRVLKMLANPAYAGAYVFGRRRSRRVVTADGRITRRSSAVPRAEWETTLLGQHPGYITWDQFLANEAKLAASNTNTGARPVREGAALCQGIIYCGGCGRPMNVHYVRGRPSYECSRSRSDHAATSGCRSVTAATVDPAVTNCLLAALSGEEVELALAAADEVTERRARTVRAAELAVDRARYEAGRAERALLACEPENRLVARTLEARLEAKLQELAETETALTTVTTAKAPLPPRAELEAAVTTLGQLWSAPTTTDRDRKRLLRTLIADITILPGAGPDTVRIGVCWRSGASEELTAERVSNICAARRSAPEVIEVVRRLGPATGNATLAQQLNAAGYRTGTGRIFDADSVRLIRRSYQIPPAALLAPGETTVAEVSDRLGVSRSTITSWIGTGLLTARRAAGRYLVAFTPEAEAACRQRIAASPQIHQHAGTSLPAPGELSPAAVAARLGISRDAVYNWVSCGHLPARRGPGGRLHIRFTTETEAACRQRIAASPQLSHEKTQALQAAPGDAL